MSFHRPHSPYDPPAAFLNATPASSLPPSHVGGRGTWDERFAGPDAWCGPSDPDAWCGMMPADEATLSRRAYHANIAFMDQQLGMVWDALNASGVLANAFVAFIADHGDGQGDHNLWRKGYPHEISSHVPMLAWWSDSLASRITLPRGSVVQEVTELRDVFATFADVGDVAIPGIINGTSLLCLLNSTCSSEAGSWRAAIDLEHDIVFNDTIHWNGFASTAWKYVLWAADLSESLFDLAVDPYEMHDLAGNASYAPVLATWRQRLVQQFQDEGRGSSWVTADGRLVARPQSQLYSPNYPGGGGVAQ